MKCIKVIPKYRLKNFLISFLYFFITLICFRKILFVDGALGYKGDWSLPFFNEQYTGKFFSKLFIYLSNGKVALRPLGQHIIQPILYFLSLLGFSGNIITKLFFISFFTLSGITMYFFLKNTFKLSNIASFIAGLIYMLNPIVFNIVVMGQHKLLFAYSLFPLFLLYFYKTIKKNKLNDSILAGIMLGFILSQSNYFMIALLFNFIFWIFNLNNIKKRKIISNSIIWMISLLIQAPFLFLQFLQIRTTVESLKSATIHWTWFNTPNIIEAFLYQLPTKHYFKTLYGMNLYFFAFLASTILIIAAISFMLYKKKKEGILYSILFLFSILIYTGSNSPFPKLTLFLYSKIPFVFNFFRTTARIGLLMILSVAILIAFFLENITSKLNFKKKFFVYFSIGLIFILFSSGFYTGDFGRGYGKSGVEVFNLPKEYEKIYTDYLGNNLADKILMIPTSQPMKYPNERDGQGHDPLVMGATTPYIGDSAKTQIERYILSKIHRDIEDISNLLGKHSIKYVIYRKDFQSVHHKFMFSNFPKILTDNKIVLQNLKKDSGLNIIEENKHYIIFENKNYLPIVHSSVNINKFKSFEKIKNFDTTYISYKEDTNNFKFFSANHVDARKGWAPFDSWYFWKDNYLYLPKKAIFTIKKNPKQFLMDTSDIKGNYFIYINLLPSTTNQIIVKANHTDSKKLNISKSKKFRWINLGKHNINDSSISFKFSDSPVALSKIIFSKNPINITDKTLFSKHYLNIEERKNFSWSELENNQLSIKAIYYPGWKRVINTMSKPTQKNTLIFPSINKSPYNFQEGRKGHSAFNSTLIYIKTGTKSYEISSISENKIPIYDIIGIWWETGWVGMGTKKFKFPIKIPPHQKAIIQINHKADNLLIESSNLSASPLTNLGEVYPHISFGRTNPTKYEIYIENASRPFFLILSENYNLHWKGYVKDNIKKIKSNVEGYNKRNIKELKHEISFTPLDIKYLLKKSIHEKNHFKANGYANAWYIDPSKYDKDGDGSFSVTLFFWPQTLFYLGLFVYSLTIVICIRYMIHGRKKN